MGLPTAKSGVWFDTRRIPELFYYFSLRVLPAVNFGIYLLDGRPAANPKRGMKQLNDRLLLIQGFSRPKRETCDLYAVHSQRHYILSYIG
jgi:hypothetical protein